MGTGNNEVRFDGRIAAVPELRSTQSGKAVMTFTLAVQREQGQDATDFLPVVAWNGTATAIAEHVVKGQQLTVAGRLQSRTYEKDGQRRTVFEVVAHEVRFGRKPKARPEAPVADETATVA